MRKRGILQSLKNALVFIVLAAVLIGGAISLIRSTVGQGTDFLVFWRTGQALLHLEPIYELRGDGMIFKYPPWIAPFFAPLGFFSFEAAKWIWGFFCIFCLAGIISTLRKSYQVPRVIWFPMLVAYWGLWAIHALDGQIVIPMLALFLWAGSTPEAIQETSREEKNKRKAISLVVMTAKVFTVFPLLFLKKNFFKLKTLFYSLLFLGALTALTGLMSYSLQFPVLFEQWKTAAVSGSKYLPEGDTRASKNQSMVAYACKHFQVAVDDTRTETGLSLLAYCLFFLAVRKRLGCFSQEERILIGLAITPVFHPLPWHHLYIFTFPLAVVSLKNWVEKEEVKGQKFISGGFLFLSLFFITMSHHRVLGPLGIFLEENRGRAWGTLLLVLWFMKLCRFKKMSSEQH